MRRESISIGIVCFILGILSGIILQWPVAKPGDGKSATTRPNETRSRISKTDALTLQTALKRVRQPLGDATGDLSDESIRAMLDDLTADHKCWDTNNPSRAIINTLLKEWTQRNHKAAWDWATTLSDKNLLEEFSAEVLRQMAHVDMDEALRLMLENHGLMPDGWSDIIINELMSAAAIQGLGKMQEVSSSLPEELLPRYPSITFPENFNFLGFAEAIRKGDRTLGEYGGNVIIQNWAVADPEAAWEWYQKNAGTLEGRGTNNFLDLLNGYSEEHGREEALRWISGKFQGAYGTDAAGYLANISESFSDSTWSVFAVADSLPSTENRDEYLSDLATYQLDQSHGRTTQFLNSLSSDKLRTDFLHDRLLEDSWDDEERAFMQALLKEWER